MNAMLNGPPSVAENRSLHMQSRRSIRHDNYNARKTLPLPITHSKRIVQTEQRRLHLETFPTSTNTQKWSRMWRTKKNKKSWGSSQLGAVKYTNSICPSKYPQLADSRWRYIGNYNNMFRFNATNEGNRLFKSCCDDETNSHQYRLYFTSEFTVQHP